MIKKYTFGHPFETDAVPKTSAAFFKDGEKSELRKFMEIKFTDVNEAESSTESYSDAENGCEMLMQLNKDDRVYGLGEAVRGINKRGWIYESWCTDESEHTEDKRSLYGAHNFLIVSGDTIDETFGIFVENPGRVIFDIGYTVIDELKIILPDNNMNLYIITPDLPENNVLKDIIYQFRRLIGKSYVPPMWAFGYGQSRWGYKTADDVRRLVDEFDKANIPVDMIFLDIDYMENYKDFTVNKERFPDMKELIAEMKEKDIHLIPIIDAAVKIEKDYDIYEEGHDKGYFCKDETGEDFVGNVWPGRCCFPDFLNSETRKWFGEKYKILTDMGIDGFWNDMNEPAIFFSDKGFKELEIMLDENREKEFELMDYFGLMNKISSLGNSEEDYKSFYHKVSEGAVNKSDDNNDKDADNNRENNKDNNKDNNADNSTREDEGNNTWVRHDTVHNLYGYNMMKAMREGCENDVLLFARASYIGAHRYGGIWQGDNKSWWSHLEMNVKMMPSLNMCGFIYTGADTGGFGADITEDLLIRWLQFSLFTPLMRNHAALGTRDQEPFRFKTVDIMSFIISMRYVLMPYIYDSFMDAVENYKLMFTPLAFEYPEDKRAVEIEDQLIVGDSLMIAPVVKQNIYGRMVYFPEDMTEVRLSSHSHKIQRNIKGKNIRYEVRRREIKAGDHYIEMPFDEIVMFVRSGKKSEFFDNL